MHAFTICITTDIRSLVRGYGGRDGFPRGRGNRMYSYGETGDWNGSIKCGGKWKREVAERAGNGQLALRVI